MAKMENVDGFEQWMKTQKPRLKPDDIKAAIMKRAPRQTLAPRGGRLSWPRWIPLLLSAAALIAVLSNIDLKKSPSPNFNSGLHMAGDSGPEALKGCRFVGLLGKAGVMEVSENGSKKQLLVYVGDEFRGLKVLEIDDKGLKFEGRDKSVVHLKIKGEAGGTVVGGPDPVQGQPGASKHYVVTGKISGLDKKHFPLYVRLLQGKGMFNGSGMLSADGKFRVGAFQPANGIAVFGDGFCYLHKQELKGDCDVSIEPKDMKVLKGRVIDDLGKPIAQQGLGFGCDDTGFLANCRLDKDGSFSMLCNEGLEWAEVNYFGYQIRKTLPEDRGAEFLIDASKEGLFRVFGKVVDEKGKPISGLALQGFGAKELPLGHASYSDKEGRFNLMFREEVSRVILAIGPAKYEFKGPWSKSHELVIDLSKESQILLEGVVRDEFDQPLASADVVLLNDKEFQMGTTKTDKDGKFFIRIKEAVQSLDFGPMDARVRKHGPWKSSAKLELNMADGKHVCVLGTVFGIDGKPAQAASIQAFDSDGRVMRYASTGKDGTFVIRNPTALSEIAVTTYKEGWELRKKSNWTGKEKVDFDFSKIKTFKLKGILKGLKGTPEAGMAMRAFDEKKKQIAYTASGKDGKWELIVNREVARITLGHGYDPFELFGPWKNDIEFEIDLSKLVPVVAEGFVTDEWGKPIEDLDVCGTPEKGIGLYVKTDKEGKYQILSMNRLKSLYIQIGLMRFERTAEKGLLAKEQNFKLADENHFLIDGHVEDLEGKRVPGVAITAETKDPGPVARVNTNDKGYYVIRSQHKITKISFNLGMGIGLGVLNAVKEGDFKRFDRVDLKMKDDGYFKLSVQWKGLEDLRNKLAEKGILPQLRIWNKDGKDIGRDIQDFKGKQFLMAREAISRIDVEIPHLGLKWAVEGLWDKSGEVELSAGADKLFVVRGTVLGKGGKPLAGGSIAIPDEKGGIQKSFMIDDKGQYALYGVSKISRVRVLAFGALLNVDVSMEKDGSQDLDISKIEVFTLTLECRDENGKAAFANADCLDESGATISTLQLIGEKQSFQTNIPIAKIKVRSFQSQDKEQVLEGLWKSDETITITIKSLGK